MGAVIWLAGTISTTTTIIVAIIRTIYYTYGHVVLLQQTGRARARTREM